MSNAQNGSEPVNASSTPTTCVRIALSLVKHPLVLATNLNSDPGVAMQQNIIPDSTVPGHTLRSDPWLTLSSLGVGTYLGNEDNETDELVASAIILSVQGGWNVIDTASNYRNGRGEKAVGYALTALHELQGFTRQMVFISTKAGFLQESMKQQLLSRKDISSEDLVGGMHCIHPACLQRSLALSLQHLRVDTVDLLYLHNPAEMQLAALGTTAFMQRLKAAFTWAEKAREQGQIRAYGLATWSCFRSAPGSADYLSLLSVVQLAQQVGGDNHGFSFYRYIQVPVNVAMPEAWKYAWQSSPFSASLKATSEDLATLMEAAGQLGVGVFGSGPLKEAALLQQPKLQVNLLKASVLGDIEGTAPKLLQIARSTPGLVATLVGHKTKEHVLGNIALSNKQPLAKQEFELAMMEFMTEANQATS